MPAIFVRDLSSVVNLSFCWILLKILNISSFSNRYPHKFKSNKYLYSNLIFIPLIIWPLVFELMNCISFSGKKLFTTNQIREKRTK